MQALEFWYEFASTYSYPAAMRIEAAAAEAGVPVLWKPFLLGPILFEQLGIKDSPFNKQPAKGRYMWRDLERTCAALNLPFNKPVLFPQNTVKVARIAMLGEGRDWLPRFSREIYKANFAETRDIASDMVLAEILTKLGQDATALLEQARNSNTKTRLKKRVDEARAKGLFGAPSFVVGNELFWGNDRLDQALAWAKQAEPSVGEQLRESAS